MKTLTHKFVENVPEILEDNVLYISILYETVIHKCCCGCGNEVVTPLSPVGWSLIFDGETVSLEPSIGNWNFECKFHYWIKNNKVHWSYTMSSGEIKKVQIKDSMDNQSQFSQNDIKPSLWTKIKEKISVIYEAVK